MFNWLANLATNRAKLVVIGAVVVTLVAGAIGGGVADKLSSFGADDPATDSYKAAQRLGDATGLDANPGLIALVHTDGPVDSAAGKAKVRQVVDTLKKDRDVGHIATAFDGGGRELISRDGRSTYVAVTFKDEKGEDATKRLRPRLDRIAGVRLGGGEA